MAAASCAPVDLKSLVFDKSLYLETSRKARVHVDANLYNMDGLYIEAKTVIREGAEVRGDLGQINIGKLCMIGPRVELHPPVAPPTSKVPFLPMNIGDNVFIGEGSVVKACDIRPSARIGAGCVVGERCLLRDCCVLLDGTVLPPDTVVPPFTVYGGTPGRMVGELCETAPDVLQKLAEDAFVAFVAATTSRR